MITVPSVKSRGGPTAPDDTGSAATLRAFAVITCVQAGIAPLILKKILRALNGGNVTVRVSESETRPSGNSNATTTVSTVDQALETKTRNSGSTRWEEHRVRRE